MEVLLYVIIILVNEMKKISLVKLFLTLFKINSITFGGGYTIVPAIRDAFVNDLNVITEDDMMNIVALAQGGPGAMAVSCSVLTGYRLRGAIGAIISLLASVLPCLIILSIIAKFYQQFKSNFFINAALEGISGVISAVLLITVYQMGLSSFKKNGRFAVGIIIISLLFAVFTNINTGLIILISGVLGIFYFNMIERSKNG